MSFQSKISEHHGSVIFQLSGKLTNEADAIQLNDQIDLELTTGKKYVIFSLEDLTHCNSTGINIFVRSLTKTRTKGGDSFIVNLNSNLGELFRITRVHEIFNIFTSLEEVQQHIQSNKK